jgi:hypothetical protein
MQYQMADTESGGCHDGLEVTGANRNQGAESTLAFLWTEVLALEANRETPAIRTGASARPFTLSLHDQSVVH